MLFSVHSGISGVFLGPDFLTISKLEDVDWATLKPEIFATIMDFFSSGQPVITETVETNEVEEVK